MTRREQNPFITYTYSKAVLYFVVVPVILVNNRSGGGLCYLCSKKKDADQLHGYSIPDFTYAKSRFSLSIFLSLDIAITELDTAQMPWSKAYIVQLT